MIPLEAALLIIGVGLGLLLITALSYIFDAGLGALISTILFGLPGALCVLNGVAAVLFVYPEVFFGAAFVLAAIAGTLWGVFTLATRRPEIRKWLVVSAVVIGVVLVAALTAIAFGYRSTDEHTITNPDPSGSVSSDIGLNARNWESLSCPDGFDSSEPTPGPHYSTGTCSVTTTSGSEYRCSNATVFVARDGSSTATFEGCEPATDTRPAGPESVPKGESTTSAPSPPMLATFSCPARPGTNEVHPPPSIGCATALRIAKLCVLHRGSAPGWTCVFRPYETNGAVLAEVRETGDPQERISVYDGNWGD